MGTNVGYRRLGVVGVLVVAGVLAGCSEPADDAAEDDQDMVLDLETGQAETEAGTVQAQRADHSYVTAIGEGQAIGLTSLPGRSLRAPRAVASVRPLRRGARHGRAAVVERLPPEWIALVSKSGRPFYTRLVPSGLRQIDGLNERLAQGGVIVDTACGAGRGLVRLAERYPACELIGVDGDTHSLALAREAVEEAGVADRVELAESPLEEFTVDRPAALVINNISMHECRDIDHVTRQVHDALEPGGLFVISDFPFPDSAEGLATPPGRVMAGIQFFEAQIDDQLLPRRTYDELLERHGFTDLSHAELTPVHALTWVRRGG